MRVHFHVHVRVRTCVCECVRECVWHQLRWLEYKIKNPELAIRLLTIHDKSILVLMSLRKTQISLVEMRAQATDDLLKNKINLHVNEMKMLGRSTSVVRLNKVEALCDHQG